MSLILKLVGTNINKEYIIKYKCNGSINIDYLFNIFKKLTFSNKELELIKFIRKGAQISNQSFLISSDKEEYIFIFSTNENVRIKLKNIFEKNQFKIYEIDNNETNIDNNDNNEIDIDNNEIDIDNNKSDIDNNKSDIDNNDNNDNNKSDIDNNEIDIDNNKSDIDNNESDFDNNYDTDIDNNCVTDNNYDTDIDNNCVTDNNYETNNYYETNIDNNCETDNNYKTDNYKTDVDNNSETDVDNSETDGDKNILDNMEVNITKLINNIIENDDIIEKNVNNSNEEIVNNINDEIVNNINDEIVNNINEETLILFKDSDFRILIDIYKRRPELFQNLLHYTHSGDIVYNITKISNINTYSKELEIIDELNLNLSKDKILEKLIKYGGHLNLTLRALLCEL